MVLFYVEDSRFFVIYFLFILVEFQFAKLTNDQFIKLDLIIADNDPHIINFQRRIGNIFVLSLLMSEQMPNRVIEF